ncbi:hypothetical protein GCM10027290_68340 [Micromonospora sonneratiae]|uniref:SUKH-4 immunity protein n=1 Tax=Micromonospora sonneratiae TaxID=1184706 RepID=A0ABW3YTN6_9ACTN
MRDDVWSPLLYPVGHYLGPVGESDTPLPSAHRVRVGEQVRTLPGGDPYKIWLVAHGAAGGPTPWTPQDVARTAGLPAHRFDAAMSELTDRGLLLAVDADLPEAEEMAGSYRWQSMLYGHGTQLGWNGLYGIGGPSEPWVLVNSLVYDVWRWTPIAATLWDACEALYESYREPFDDDDIVVDSPRAMLSQLLPSLHSLICSYAGYLDEAW